MKRARASLAEYEHKRDFERTPEPSGRGKERGRAKRAAKPVLSFVIQQHAARAMHFDFRLELDGVLKSWAVPKGPSLDPSERRMAVHVEDHPLEYAGFEGVIPKGEYGAGTVVVWDRGTWEPIGDSHAGLERGKLEFLLHGEKLHGRWHLVRMRPRAGDRGKSMWLLIKGRDAEARSDAAAKITEKAPASVLSGRTLKAVARDADRVWSSKTGEVKPPRSRARASRREAESAAARVGLKRAALPRTIAPQLATLVDVAPEGDAWLHELKLDGYRILARLERGKVRLLTRNGHDWTAAMPEIAAPLTELPVTSALLDGEVVALDAAGRSDFQRLQGALKSTERDLRYYVFDLLHLDGFDLRDAPLVDRKQALRSLLERGPRSQTIQLSEHVVGGGGAFFAEACRSGGEGIVSKLAAAPYRPQRTRAWVKVKCGKRQEFVVVGFTDPAGSRAGFGALLLGVHDASGALRYAGKVGTGFSADALGELRAKLGRLEREKPPVVDAARAERGAHWVAPKLVAEVSFSEWTRDGKVRHPAFVALRTDKPPAEIRREEPEAMPKQSTKRKAATKRAPKSKAPAAATALAAVAGVRLSSPDRVYFPEVGVTKSELAQYWETMAERALPGIVNRPLTVVRCPEGHTGECFYQKHATDSVSKEVGRVVVRRGEPPYMRVDDLAGVVSLVQIGVLEIHVWGARADQLERPDLFVLDLDPDPAVPWRAVADTARGLRALLEELGFVPFLRTTGGKGLHVVVPLVRRSGWDEVKSFTHAIALRLVREAPDRFTAQVSKEKRKGRILIDYLRNQRDATAIASYSVRARPGAPVAMPIAWEEIEAVKSPPAWDVRTAPKRLAEPDPWRDFEKSRRVLTARARARIESS